MSNYLIKFSQKRLFKKNYVALEKNLSVIRNIRKKLSQKRSEKIKGLDVIVNINHYYALCSYDIAISLKYLSFSSNSREKNYFARISALIIFEFLDDLNGLFIKRFRLQVQNFTDRKQIQKLDLILKEFHVYKANNFSEFKKIRNNTLGHRELDVRKQDYEISKIDVHKITELTIEIVELFSRYIDWSSDFYEEFLKDFE